MLPKGSERPLCLCLPNKDIIFRSKCAEMYTLPYAHLFNSKLQNNLQWQRLKSVNLIRFGPSISLKSTIYGQKQSIFNPIWTFGKGLVDIHPSIHLWMPNEAKKAIFYIVCPRPFASNWPKSNQFIVDHRTFPGEIWWESVHQFSCYRTTKKKRMHRWTDAWTDAQPENIKPPPLLVAKA